MSETVTPENPPNAPASFRRRMLRGALWVVGAFAVFAFVTLNLGTLVPLVVLWELATGWFEFLQRVVPLVVDRTDQLPGFVLALGVVLGGMHWFLSWLRGHQRAIADGGSEKPPWRFRWTAAIAGLIAASTLLAMAGIGIIHQTGWMLVSTEPTWVYKGGGYSAVGIANMINLSIEQQYLSKELPPMTVPISIPSDDPVQYIAKDFRMFALANDRGKFGGLIVFRKPGTFGDDRSIVVMDGSGMATFPRTELLDVIARYGHRMHPLQ